ncbi:MAG TPA: hypothetical protein VFZ65_16815 [Planctomycetota bacterium]|nr:hypothetical protein [Planctomycetota bacterium]
MVEWSSLLIPIVVSAVLIFFASSVIHMALKYHNADYRMLPNEDAVAAAIRQGGAAPGQYVIPHCKDHKQMNTPEMQRKFTDGPCGLLYLRPSHAIQMGPFLGRWIAYTLAVSAAVAYLARAELHAGAPYLTVFRLVGTAAWFAYGWQGPADSIWKGKPWIVTFKEMFDGLIYASLTAGTFAWLWPAAA